MQDLAPPLHQRLQEASNRREALALGPEGDGEQLGAITGDYDRLEGAPELARLVLAVAEIETLWAQAEAAYETLVVLDIDEEL